MPNLTFPNRLINEKSPYLLEHAHNPVDWYPWGEEAFRAAKEKDKPIFLSIGYSGCHWRHVMEKEVFTSEKAAALLNKYFISIKVDREEKPDIDNVYTEACVALTGSEGWPLNVLMTPDKDPFFVSCYFSEDQFFQTIQKAADMWNFKRDEIIKASKETIALIDKYKDRSIDTELIRKGYEYLLKNFDKRNGGFGGAPKYPCAHALMFLYRYSKIFNVKKAQEMADITLRQMCLGGIRDHIGGGFYSYSTDEFYLIPRFEKTLCDNAMMILIYSEAGIHDIAEETINFCIRELRSTGAAFYTSIGAGSKGEGGHFTPSEIESALGTANSEKFCEIYDITQKGNYNGSNVPNLLKHGEIKPDEIEFDETSKKLLLSERKKRVSPSRDEKILLSSNSLMIAALATAGKLTNNQDYVDIAIEIVEFIESNMRLNGRLHASYTDILSPCLATSDDYTYYAWGLYRLHQAALDDKYLELCKQIFDEAVELFASDKGPLYLSGKDEADSSVRSFNIRDGALPSGNSIFAGVSMRLYTLTGDSKYKSAFDKISDSVSPQAADCPENFLSLLSAAMLNNIGGIKVTIPKNFLNQEEITSEFHPFASILSTDGNQAFISHRESCMKPTADINEVKKEIEEAERANI